MKWAGFTFQDPEIKKVEVQASAFLSQFQDQVNAFAKDEDFAESVLAASKDNAMLQAIDHKRWSSFSSAFWQSRDWWFNLQKIVPFLVLELLKFQPANNDKLAKIQQFWVKPFRWSYKMDPYGETSAKYLSVLKTLRDQLTECQKAAAKMGTEGVSPIIVGKFELYDSLGLDSGSKQKVVDTIKQGTRSMTSLGLGSYCYGKVTILDSAKFASRSSAFYVANTDEMYVSPEMKGQEVRAFCHEVTHRVFHKLNLSSRAASLYDICSDRGLWVTPYAKTNAEENLCEMVSFAAVGKLPKEADDLLRVAVPKIKLANAGQLVRRWIVRTL
jgi:hypothetical protein